MITLDFEYKECTSNNLNYKQRIYHSEPTIAANNIRNTFDLNLQIRTNTNSKGKQAAHIWHAGELTRLMVTHGQRPAATRLVSLLPGCARAKVVVPQPCATSPSSRGRRDASCCCSAAGLHLHLYGYAAGPRGARAALVPRADLRWGGGKEGSRRRE